MEAVEIQTNKNNRRVDKEPVFCLNSWLTGLRERDQAGHGGQSN